jgi:hypothetical protein
MAIVAETSMRWMRSENTVVAAVGANVAVLITISLSEIAGERKSVASDATANYRGLIA